jgi:hypothetical protein
MKSKIMIGVVAVVVIALGVGIWLFMGRGGAPVVPILPGQKVSDPKTIGELIAAGRPLKCTVTPTAENGQMSGTFYSADKKMRSDSSTDVGGKIYSSHMILLNDVAYIWQEGQNTGLKTFASNDANAEGAGDEGPDTTKDMGFKCETWMPDAGTFALPAGVKFSDIGSMIPSIPSGATNGSASPSTGLGTGAPAAGGNAAQCATCDQLPAEYKAQCLSSLGCK